MSLLSPPRVSHYIAAAAVVLLVGCGTDGFKSDSAVTTIPWPPDESLARTASDESVVLFGRQYSAVGGEAVIEGNQLKLGPSGGNLTWAMYSLQGFDEDSQLGSASADFTQFNSGFGDQTRINFALANFELGRWEWFELTPSDGEFDITDSSAYTSPGGSVHVAAVLSGNGYGRVREIRLDRVGPGANVPVPSGLTAEPVPGSVNLSWDPVDLALGYNVYRSSDAAFSDEMRLNGPPVTQPFYNDATVIKFEEYWYRVSTVRSGQESAKSAAVSVTALDTTLTQPQNLSATANVGTITLEWDPVPGANSYNIQRATKPNFEPFTSLMSSQASHADSTVTNGLMYYYRVIAVGQEMSPPSEYVDIFAPRVNLPLPENFRVVPEESQGDWITFAWDFPFDPTEFRIWLHTYPDFWLDGMQINLGNIPGDKRMFVRHDLPSGTTFYARMAASSGGTNFGRMTDSIQFTVDEYWSFGPTETITEAQEPFAVVSDGTDLTLAYLNQTDNAVRLARRNNGAWTAGISCDLEPGTRNEGGTNIDWEFAQYVDLAYADGQHVVAAHAATVHHVSPNPQSGTDCWVSVGNPGGSWDATVLSGVMSAATGLYVRAAAGDSELAVSHLSVDSGGEMLLHTRPASGGAWGTQSIRAIPVSYLDHSSAFLDGALHIADYDVMSDDLMYGVSDSAFNWTAINVTLGDGVAAQNRLTPFGSGLLTPAYSPYDVAMYAYQGVGDTFERQEVLSGKGSLTRADLAVDGDRAVMTFIRASNPLRFYYAELVDGVWYPATISGLGSVDLGLKVVANAGEFYIIYLVPLEEDKLQLRCARGNPPS